MTTGPMAGRQHDGRLLATCPCGWQSTPSDTPALVQLLEHRRRTNSPALSLIGMVWMPLTRTPPLGMRAMTAAVTRLMRALRKPRYRRLGAEHWTLHHAPKPHPPVKANRRVHRRRK